MKKKTSLLQDIIGLGSPGDRFTSPLSAERSEALSALFEGGEKAKTVDETKKGIGVVRSATEKTLGKIPIVRELPPLVQQQILVGGASAAASAVASFFKGEFREQLPDESMEDYLAERKKVVGSQMRTYFDNYFKFDKDYSTMTDEEKDQFVARYNVAKGGRIGFQEGSKDAKSSVEFTREELGLGPLKINQEIDKLLKEGVDIEIIKSMTGAPDELIQERIRFFKYGGAKVPLKKAKGGVMSIPVRKNSAGVKELDMRKSGGFVPIGVKEKADDVPAMLSLNEFVMTADAVRGAGDGNVKKGAQRMYDTMKKLESRVG